LYEIHENQKLRQAQPMWITIRNEDGTVTQKRKPVRVDLHYMISVWAAEPEDEHRLLARTMLAIFRHPHLPDNVMPESLKHQQRPIELMAAQPNALQNPVDIWTVLDNEMGPAIGLTVTMALDPYVPTTSPLVTEREIRFRPEVDREKEAAQDVFHAVRVSLESKKPLQDARVVLVDQGVEFLAQESGDVAIGRLREGKYTLEVSAEGRAPTRHEIDVPHGSYTITIK
jgi:hypothetical protein